MSLTAFGALFFALVAVGILLMDYCANDSLIERIEQFLKENK